MKGKWLPWLLILALLLSLSVSGAEDAPRAVLLAADGEETFSVSLSLHSAVFSVLQMALRYDPAVLQPIDPQGGAADTLWSCAQLEADCLSPASALLDPEAGLLSFALYVPPGAQGEHITHHPGHGTQAAADGAGLPILTLRFRRLKGGDPGLRLATEAKGEPYLPSCPDGVILFGDGAPQAVEVSLRSAPAPAPTEPPVYTPVSPKPGPGGGSPRPQPDITPDPEPEPQPEPEPPPDTDPEPLSPPRTPELLLPQIILLPIGDHAAVVRGAVTAIYPGEPSVTAYAHDNRTFVPVRFVAEQLGAEVAWDNATYTVTVEQNGHTISMAVGALTYRVDGEERTLDVPAEFLPSKDGNSRTMVPVRFLTEGLGYRVEWDQARNLVVIIPPALLWDRLGEAESQTLDRGLVLWALYSSFV